MTLFPVRGGPRCPLWRSLPYCLRPVTRDPRRARPLRPTRDPPRPMRLPSSTASPYLRSAYDDYLKSLLRGKPATDLTAEEKNQVLDQMINMQFIATQAEKDGLDKDPDVVARASSVADAGAGRRRRAEVSQEPRADRPGPAGRILRPRTRPNITPGTSWCRPRRRPRRSSRRSRPARSSRTSRRPNPPTIQRTTAAISVGSRTARMVKPFGDAVKGLKKGEMTNDRHPDPIRLAHHQAGGLARRALRPNEGAARQHAHAEEISGLYRQPEEDREDRKEAAEADGADPAGSAAWSLFESSAWPPE